MTLWPGGPEFRIAGVPLRVTPLFVAVATLFAWLGTRHLSTTSIVPTPPRPSGLAEVAVWLQRYGVPEIVVVRASPGWVLAAGAGVALVYALSVLAHELGHLLAARVVGVKVSALQLDAAGGFVEMDDDDRLTAGKLAVIVAAGPAATLAVLVAAVVAAHLLDAPANGAPELKTSAGLVLDRIVSYLVGFNAIALAVNLLPIRPLDGGQLLGAARLALARTR
jgi:Zn-dependent protease